jgi:hypothetical protein
LSAIAYPELNVNSRSAIWKKFFELAGYQVRDSNIEGDTKVMLTSEIFDLAQKPFNGTKDETRDDTWFDLNLMVRTYDQEHYSNGSISGVIYVRILELIKVIVR